MRIVSIVAARPNFIKLAGVYHALREYSECEHVIIHTGQHYDPLFSDVFFRELALPEPDINLGIRSAGSNEDTVQITSEAIVPVLRNLSLDFVLVYGDVSGALAGALAAEESEVPVAHVEAGLRSFDAAMPEERNRIAIDKRSKLLFVTEQSGLDHLRAEKITNGTHLVGNTMVDTLVRMLPVIGKQRLPAGLPKAFGLVTLHRPSNVDAKEDLERNITFLNQVAERCPLVFPVHHRTRAALDRHHLTDVLSDKIHRIDPLGYLEFLRLVQDTAFLITDSGGIQEETVLLRKKCFTLRKNTERPVTITAGANELINLEKETDRDRVLSFAAHPQDPIVTIPLLWDGKAGERIGEILCA